MDGIIDSALLMVYEGRFNPAEMRVDRFVGWRCNKIIRALQSIEPAPMPAVRCRTLPILVLPVRGIIWIFASRCTGVTMLRLLPIG